MALNRHERKERLGFGGVTRIARRTRRSKSHVSMVLNEQRSDPIVERAIAKAIGLTVEEVFPPTQAHATERRTA